MDKKRILFVAESASLAHVGRAISLARSLPEENVVVGLACGKSLHRWVPSSIETLESTSLSPEEFRRRLARGEPILDESLLRLQVNEDLSLLQNWTPDLVVGDFRPSLGISAAVAGVPYMNVVDAYWSPWAREPFSVPSPLDRWPLRSLPFSWTKTLLDAAMPLFFQSHAQPFNRVRREHGLPPVADLRGVYGAGDFVAHPGLPEIVPTVNAPAHHRHIGPVLWEPPTRLPSWWTRLPSDRPLVYVTFGGTGSTAPATQVIEALAQLPVTTVVATSGRLRLAPVPGRLYTADYLPGIALCRRARLVINNGGSGSVYQALAAGVPVLGIAANLDQSLMMGALERAGAGRRILGGFICREPLRDVLHFMLESPDLQRKARGLAHRIQQASGPTFRGLVSEILSLPTENREPVGTVDRTGSDGAFLGARPDVSMWVQENQNLA
jgi:UDP:flavonoid glycosyltransferase YjiC (YdhE family)